MCKSRWPSWAPRPCLCRRKVTLNLNVSCPLPSVLVIKMGVIVPEGGGKREVGGGRGEGGHTVSIRMISSGVCDFDVSLLAEGKVSSQCS